MKFQTKTIVAGIALSLMAGAANAGGYNRGSANLDSLYADGLEVIAGMTWVSPGRSYDRVSGLRPVNNPAYNGANSPVLLPSDSFPPPAGTVYSYRDVEFGQDFQVPYVSVGGQLAENFACVGSYSEPYGAHSVYSGAMTYNVKEVDLSVKEYGLTCSLRANLEKGRLSIIGGVFQEQLDFMQSRTFPSNLFTASGILGGSGDSMIKVSSEAWGWRAGIAYEIPEIALRASLIYRSETRHDVKGKFINTPIAAIFGSRAQAAAAAGDPAAVALAGFAAASAGASSAKAYGTVNLPQQVEFNFQSGIAPGWLAFGSVKWTDWSIIREVNLNDSFSRAEFTDVKAYFNDGWTVTGGIGHQVNEQLSVAGSITWDKGVTSGWDTFTDTWTYAGTVVFNATENFSIRATAAAINFTEGSKKKTDGPLDYVAHSPNEWGHALNIQGTVRF